MAFKSVVVDPFFERVASILRGFEMQRGPLSLVLANPSYLQHSQWDVTVAAEWIDSMSPLKAGTELDEFLRKGLPASGIALGLVKIRSTSDILVRSVTSELEIPHFGTAYRVSGFDLDLYSMEDAVCLLSRPVRRVSLTEKVPA